MCEFENVIASADSSHDDLLDYTESSVSALLKSDSLLNDLPVDISIDEIESQTAVEHGKMITIFIHRENAQPMKVPVQHNATVRSLKKAVNRQFEHFKRRHGIKVKINWKHIWNTYSLNYDSIELDDNNACIQEYGVTNKVTLIFKKKKGNKRNE